MNVGDVVTVRVTGQRARIVEVRGGYFSIEYLPDAIGDPMDRDQSRSSEAAGHQAAPDADGGEKQGSKNYQYSFSPTCIWRASPTVEVT